MCYGRRYANSHQIALAVNKYKTGNRKGINFSDLVESGLAIHKKQAQGMLKYHLRKGTVFTLRNARPQEYYPTVMKSEIVKNDLARIIPIDPTGVTYSANTSVSVSKNPLSNCIEAVVNQTLEGVTQYY